MILTWFWWKIVNNEVAQFITACTHFQLVKSCSHEAHHLIHIIESDTLFDVVFLDFLETGYITYQDGYLNILTFLNFMTGL